MPEAQIIKASATSVTVPTRNGATAQIPAIGLGGVRISVMRTCVMPQAPHGLQVLPPSVGVLPVVEAGRFPKAIEALGGADQLITVLPAGNAFWLSIASNEGLGKLGFGGDRYALIVGANGVNTITGLPFKAELERNAFYAVPGQQWIDGANNGRRSVGQFIAQPLGLGDGLGEQLYENSEFGGLDFVVFRKAGPSFDAVLGQDFGDLRGFDSLGMRGGGMTSFGGSHAVGMGASIRQTTVKGAIDGFDPSGPRHIARLHILDPDLFADLTDTPRIEFPRVSVRDLLQNPDARFYVIDDGNLPDIESGIELGAQVQTVGERSRAAGDVPDSDLEPLVIPPEMIEVLPRPGIGHEFC